MAVTSRPQHLMRRPRLLVMIPLPRPDKTPPVTMTYRMPLPREAHIGLPVKEVSELPVNGDRTVPYAPLPARRSSMALARETVFPRSRRSRMAAGPWM